MLKNLPTLECYPLVLFSSCMADFMSSQDSAFVRNSTQKCLAMPLSSDIKFSVKHGDGGR